MIKFVYTTTKKGRMILRGNTIGIADAAATCCRQYGLITLDPAQSAGVGYPTCTSTTLPGCPFGTTLDWTQAGSFCDIDIDATESVEYAFLLWAMAGGAVDTPITFNTPIQTVTITGDPTYSLGTSDGYFSYITRGINVTNLVKAGMGGRYSVEGIPTPAINMNIGTGWCLAVVITSPTLPIKNMSIYAVSEVNYPNDVSITVTGFKAPAVGPVNANVYVAAQYGDAVGGGDYFSLDGVNLSGPKNLESNFFQGQIVDENGNYYNSSMSTYNAIPSIPTGTVVPYARQDYDITTIRTIGIIQPNAISAIVKVPLSTSDTVGVNFLGLELDALAAILEVNKSSNKTVSYPGDTIRYTIVISNTGTDSAVNINFFDTIPTNTTFVSNSLKINGITQIGQGPNGISIPNINKNEQTTVSFDVLVSDSIVNPTTIVNISQVIYSTNGVSARDVTDSNILSTPIRLQPSLSKISKIPSKYFGSNGENITYTIIIPNTSSITANNVILKDTIPNGVNYQIGSVVINGTPNTNADIRTGINLGNLIGGSVTTVTFDVIITTIVGSVINSANVSYEDPSLAGVVYYNESLEVITTIPNAIISSIKTVNPSIMTINDTITYTIALYNTGNVSGVSYLLDTLPLGLDLIANSLNQDGTTISNTGNISTTLPNEIAINSVSTVTFKVLVTSVPSINPFDNIANITTSYIYDPTTTPNITKLNSVNSTMASILVNNINLSMVKYVDKKYATTKDIIKYTVVCKNTGNISGKNILFVDTLANGTVFVQDSFSINGTAQIGVIPQNGISLPDIGPNETVTLTFLTEII